MKNLTDKHLEEIFEVAFGDNAINKGYSIEKVIKRLKATNSDRSELIDLLQENYNSIDDFEAAKNNLLDDIL